MGSLSGLAGAGGSDNNADLRRIVPHWNHGMVAASIAVSFLGAFTSTQLMVQAKTSRYLAAVICWAVLASLTFGFCSIWCLHFIAMLACEMDLPIGLDPGLTVLSAILAVAFTFLALATDIVWATYQGTKRKQRAAVRREAKANNPSRPSMPRVNSALNAIRAIYPPERPKAITDEHEEFIPSSILSSPLLDNGEQIPIPFSEQPNAQFHLTHDPLIAASVDSQAVPLLQRPAGYQDDYEARLSADDDNMDIRSSSSGFYSNGNYSSSGYIGSRRSSGVISSDPSLGFGMFASVKTKAIRELSGGHKNPFLAIGLALYAGLSFRNIAKGFAWSLAITGMHYSGVLALKIPHGSCKLSIGLVILSGVICWIVCVVGCILMASMETRLAQQLLFSAIATAGVAAMHFTGMRAATFWSYDLPSEDRGYPNSLVIAIVSVAIVTCIAANGLLAHSTTIARNKLAEIVYTKKNMWAAIAQKENAEAAAVARSEFIASASHEIRSPIHQLQGYSDLLARAKLDDEGRLLLHAMQDAIRSLSLITTTVLDWSRIEKGEAICRPTAVNIRRICESVLNILPSKDEDSDAELLIAVHPDVPASLFIDETYLHRIIMNLLSNSLKFTSHGYVMLQVKCDDQDVVVTVKDTGNGIPESFLPHLFEPFKQAQSRGPQRGTGLGLSIVKQLLQKMKGTIGVESKDSDTYPGGSGTTFTATFPVQPTGDVDSELPKLSGKIAVYGEAGNRGVEGIRTSWELLGVETTHAEATTPLTADIKYVWTKVEYLRDNPLLLRRLRDNDHQQVLIPCDNDKRLSELVGSTPPTHFIPLRRPLLFHKIIETINNHGKKPNRPETLSRTVRFASAVDLVDPTTPDEAAGPAPKVIMLVEDNKVNQRLGAKMLRTLGYDVIIANDGQEAIDLLVENEQKVDAILMDQSMPRKDGLTATKEIREMEADGTLAPRNGRPRPIIAVTAVVGAHAEAMCRQAGTDYFLPKPLSLSKLRSTLETYLARDDAALVGHE
ncbi:hypothetical protein K461DRAFT_261416 [Myriangium duriaei CBS 260.36]|uniref:Histidine kinase n=1 Tax=Myriangium duriaei CBS 260.36 TaxID=1168546 RepID=A0A9P4IVL4_9PEZI|nr:hypothetical protein K461DRAFT_261416 [Myriangium duriaei CBS 260.36]